MKQRIMKVVLVTGISIVLMAMSLPVNATSTALTVNGSPEALSMSLIMGPTEPMIALKDVTSILGGTLSWNEWDKSIKLINGSEVYSFKPNSQAVDFNGTTKLMKTAVVLQDGRSFVPITVFSDVFGGTATQKDATWNVTLKSSAQGQYGEYTFDQLYQLALDNSDALKQAKMNIERAEIVNDEKSELHTNGLPSATGNGAADAVRLANLATLKASEISLRSAEIAYLTTQDQIKYNLQTLIDKKKVADSALSLAKRDYEIQLIKSQQSALKYDQGLISLFEFEKNKRDLDSKANAVKIKESENASIDLSLDNMLKLENGYAFLANGNVVLDVLKDRDITAHIATITSESPTIWALEQQIELSQFSITYYVYNAGADPYDAKAIDVSKARLTLQQTKDATALSLRQSFENLTQLEQTIESLTFELEKSKQDLQQANLNYQVGLIPKLTLMQADYAVQAYEHQLNSTKNTYNTLKRAYERPWAAQ